ncbi:Multicopper oxidase type 1 [Trinorchestia longiramus]|nr:Multicopper oxidase type 1 [Trinorchestia longiramus]
MVFLVACSLARAQRSKRVVDVLRLPCWYAVYEGSLFCDEVCQGDEIIVDLENDLMSDTTSIHWHGLHMVGTPYMDGVPQLTQCPIQPGTTFRYSAPSSLGPPSGIVPHPAWDHLQVQCLIQPGTNFRYSVPSSPGPPSGTVSHPKWDHLQQQYRLVVRYHFLADKPGTHYWHSHSGFQRADGMFGSLVVRTSEDPIAHLYDIDDPSHVLVLTDWLEDLAIKKFVYHHHSVHDNKPYNILVNGRGYIDTALAYEGRHPPLSVITVKQGYRHRIRSVSNSIQNCPIEVSVDGHNMTLVTKDGSPVQPIQVESFVIYGGERWDFVIEANNCVENYWIKFHGLLDCDDRFKSAHQVAVLRYEGAPDSLPSDITDMTWALTKREGFQVNTLNKAPGDETFLTAAEIQSFGETVDYSGTPDHTFWIDFDFHPSNNDLFHHEDYYPFYAVPKKHRLFMPQMNYISLMLPSSPPLSQPESVPPQEFCNAEHPPVTPNNNCTTDFCACFHTLSVRKDSLVEMVLIDKGLTYYANHPFHLHGHEFAVVGMGKLGSNTTRQEVQNLEKNGLLMRNFNQSTIMDTVTVPDGGYTVIRFWASNPGYWLFHCHISFHIEVGMGLVIKVGDDSMFAPAPPNFPRCGNFAPTRTEDLKGSDQLTDFQMIQRLLLYFLAQTEIKCIEGSRTRNSSITRERRTLLDHSGGIETLMARGMVYYSRSLPGRLTLGFLSATAL